MVNAEAMLGNGLSDAKQTESLQSERVENSQEFAPLSSELVDSWGRVLEKLRMSLDPHLFAAYLESLRIVSADAATSTFILAAPSGFICSHIERNFKPLLIEAVQSELGWQALELQLVDERSLGGDASPSKRIPVIVKKVIRSIPHPPPLGTEREVSSNAADFPHGLNSRYTFSNFVVGNSNQFCHAAALRVAENPGKSYNPLFIYGGVGLGKTHILHAIGNSVLSKNPRARVVYMSSETFTNELIQALRNAKMDEFKRRIRGVDVLLIDDIQFMCGKERTQEEFFHTFNTLYNAKHQIVLTSDKIPQDIPGIEERLQTRFSWGLTADMQSPDFETRVAILRRNSAAEGFNLPEDVAHFIAERVSSNVRELEGALTKIHAICSLQNVVPTVEVAANALRPLLQPKIASISIEDIKRAVSSRFGIKVSEIISKRRTKNLSFPRHIAMYLCRKHTTCSYPEIGSSFGNRDHSSVIHAANVVAAKVNSDKDLRDIISDIERELLSR